LIVWAINAVARKKRILVTHERWEEPFFEDEDELLGAIALCGLPG
jgi:hypothetical protein